MRKSQFPFREYLPVPGLILLFGAAWFCSQQWLQFRPWWVDVPWIAILATIAAFGLGTFYADLYNDNSQLRRWWADRRRVFNVVFHPASDVKDGYEVQTPYFSVRFIGPVTGHSLELVLYEHLQWSFNKPAQLLLRVDAVKFSEGEHVRVPIATIAQAAHGPHFWGDGTANKSPIPGTGNLVEVRAVKKGRVKQRYSVFIAYRENEAATGNIYSFLQEDRHVFRQ
ncbi:hypothetical protein Nwi_1279 [Nitrobacter winogradskyi Nb-255]|uniref:Uncharacterized protein n=1 Tax=Nitrobacter winogradskyi (strain ATCC 25391 / DSM 10237 / CIP 104748 / NCIMB 11846 / Nb-255) TaxID=323098 RepID=Q3ST51_NITWN|nr:hypothetical protein [Nitrobacter winogradskyi]ABA04540.1 hypothetical protein Nwi_1279 [Nitrobacter winogradskyi Nb-255]